MRSYINRIILIALAASMALLSGCSAFTGGERGEVVHMWDDPNWLDVPSKEGVEDSSLEDTAEDSDAYCAVSFFIESDTPFEILKIKFGESIILPNAGSPNMCSYWKSLEDGKLYPDGESINVGASSSLTFRLMVKPIMIHSPEYALPSSKFSVSWGSVSCADAYVVVIDNGKPIYQTETSLEITATPTVGEMIISIYSIGSLSDPRLNDYLNEGLCLQYRVKIIETNYFDGEYTYVSRDDIKNAQKSLNVVGDFIKEAFNDIMPEDAKEWGKEVSKGVMKYILEFPECMMTILSIKDDMDLAGELTIDVLNAVCRMINKGTLKKVLEKYPNATYFKIEGKTYSESKDFTPVYFN